MKKVLMLISNDQHLDLNNQELIYKLMIDQMNIAIELGLSEVTLLGDMFDVRPQQKLDVMVNFLNILDEYEKYGIKMVTIPGNHDKADYSSYNSWMTIYRNHPALDLMEDIEVRNIGGLSVTFLPFFTEEMLVEKIEAAKPSDILLSHFELNGSTNNGRVSTDRAITQKMLSKFTETYLGHYHDEHTIGGNIHHLHSLYQRGFGEDDKKGFTVLYDDLSFESISSNFKHFKTIKIDVDTFTPKKQNELIKSKDDNTNLRIEIFGKSEKLDAINKNKFYQVGIDVVLKRDELYVIEDEDSHKVGEERSKGMMLSKDDVRVKFKKFCQKDGLDEKDGFNILEKVLINK